MRLRTRQEEGGMYLTDGRPEQNDGGRRERHLVDRHRDGVLYFASLLALEMKSLPSVEIRRKATKIPR